LHWLSSVHGLHVCSLSQRAAVALPHWESERHSTHVFVVSSHAGLPVVLRQSGSPLHSTQTWWTSAHANFVPFVPFAQSWLTMHSTQPSFKHTGRSSVQPLLPSITQSTHVCLVLQVPSVVSVQLLSPTHCTHVCSAKLHVLPIGQSVGTTHCTQRNLLASQVRPIAQCALLRHGTHVCWSVRHAGIAGSLQSGSVAHAPGGSPEPDWPAWLAGTLPPEPPLLAGVAGGAGRPAMTIDGALPPLLFIPDLMPVIVPGVAPSPPDSPAPPVAVSSPALPVSGPSIEAVGGKHTAGSGLLI
jgi:hypothetical protein